jgi:Spondin_N
MLNLKRSLVAMLALSMLGMLLAPYRAAAQAGTKTYEVTVTNITTSMQGLSPLVIATHPASVDGWQMGQPASAGLELLAEEGMTGMLAGEWKAAGATDVMTTGAHLLPGDSITVRITAKDGDVVSAATMLIQTNDGFTGLDSAALTDGNTDTMAYDAGTEENTEAKADVPGPPLGGKNSGPATNPRGAIGPHETIQGRADVTPEFDWTGPVARFTIRAIPTPTVTGPTYDVTVTNITTSMQGLSPLVIASHPASVDGWQMGQPASAGLELLAEEGMTGMLAGEWKAAGATDVMTTGAHLFPGDSITVRITAKQGDVLSAATMLIQTNDGFTGLDSAALTDGNTDTMAYDAGTEENTEAKADVPGPPLGGKNSGPATNPRGAIGPHETIQGRADVTPEFDWTGPVARFTIRTVAASAQPTSVPAATSVPATAVPPVSVPPTSVPPVSVSPTSISPDMPKTGAADTGIWLIVATGAAALALLGFALRRTTATRR